MGLSCVCEPMDSGGSSWILNYTSIVGFDRQALAHTPGFADSTDDGTGSERPSNFSGSLVVF